MAAAQTCFIVFGPVVAIDLNNLAVQNMFIFVDLDADGKYEIVYPEPDFRLFTPTGFVDGPTIKAAILARFNAVIGAANPPWAPPAPPVLPANITAALGKAFNAAGTQITDPQTLLNPGVVLPGKH